MRVLLFVEGETERDGLPPLLARLIRETADVNVKVQPICFRGAQNYLKEIATKVGLYLKDPKARDIVAAVGFVDLYGLNIPLPNWEKASTADKVAIGRKHIESEVGNARFRQYFAVHETEALILADTEQLPPEVRKSLPGKCIRPEEVNHDQPPSKLLDRLYRDKVGRPYRKTVDGINLLRSLSYSSLVAKCPYFRAMLDDLTALIKAGTP